MTGFQEGRDEASRCSAQVRSTKYASSADPRGYLPVWEYEVNGQTIMWDRQTGYVHFTGIWKALGNNKADVVRLVEMYPALEHTIRKIRGGTLKLQGTWLPSQTARRLAERTCWPIRFSLTPLFGDNFPESCWPPDRPGYGQLALENEMRGRRRAIPQRTVSARVSGQGKLCTTPSPKRLHPEDDRCRSPDRSSSEAAKSEESDSDLADRSPPALAPWTQGPEHHQLLAGYDGYKSGATKKSHMPTHSFRQHRHHSDYAIGSMPYYASPSMAQSPLYHRHSIAYQPQMPHPHEIHTPYPSQQDYHYDRFYTTAQSRPRYRPYHHSSDHITPRIFERERFNYDTAVHQSINNENYQLAPLRSSLGSSNGHGSEAGSRSPRTRASAKSPDIHSRTLPPLSAALDGTLPTPNHRPPPRRRSSGEQTYGSGSFASTSQMSRESSPVHTPNLREATLQKGSYFDVHPHSYPRHGFYDRSTLSCSRYGKADVHYYPCSGNTGSLEHRQTLFGLAGPDKDRQSSAMRWLPETAALTGPHSLSAYRIGPKENFRFPNGASTAISLHAFEEDGPRT